MSPLWAVVGSTGTGKSRLALELAERVGGEIVCVDSAQVFRRLDIGTAKPTHAERARVPHHVLDLIEPTEQFTSAAFAEAADRAIADVRGRGRVPILCGGTGLWLRALTRGLFSAQPISEAVRGAVRERLAREGAPSLHSELAARDPAAAARLHPNDSQRIGRALEYVLETGVPISTMQEAHAFGDRRHAWRGVALDWPRAALVERLEQRTRQMLAFGLVDEVRALVAEGVPRDAPGLRSIGYREIVRFLSGLISVEEAETEINVSTRQYAKRQRNWFSHDPEVRWLRPEATVDEALAALNEPPQSR